MADYYPLLARAIDGLPDKTEAGRKVVYERARRALLNQLRAADPPLREEDVARERQALEVAIARLEREHGRTAEGLRDFGANLAAALNEPPAPSPAAGRAASPPPAGRTAPLRPVSPTQVPPTQVPPSAAARPGAPVPSSPASSPTSPPVPGQRPPLPPRSPIGEPPAALRPAAPPVAAPGWPAPERPSPERGGPGREAVPPDRASPDRASSSRGSSAGWDDDDDYVSRLSAPRRDGAPWPGAGAAEAGTPSDADVESALADGATDSRSSGTAEQERSARRGYGRIIAFLVILVLLAAGGVVGFTQRETVVGLVRSLSGPARQAVQAPPPAQPEAAVKSSDRIAQAPGTAASSGADRPAPAAPAQPAPATAPQTGAPAPVDINAPQRAALFEESAGGGEQGLQQYVGTVVWSTETYQPGDGQAPDIGIRAVATIPDRNFKVTLRFRRNQDPSIPASHIIEVQFDLPPNFDLGNASSVPGMRAKSSEGAQGVPLTGLAVRVAPGFFLIGLSSLDSDRQRNLGLLITRNFLDVPVAFDNGRRAILVLEKGPPGDQAFRQAFMAWGLPIPADN